MKKFLAKTWNVIVDIAMGITAFLFVIAMITVPTTVIGGCIWLMLRMFGG